MRRSNTTFVRSNIAFRVSIVIHVLAALIFAQLYREAAIRKGTRSIAVDLNVKVPEPRLQRKMVEIEQPDINPEVRTVDRRTAREMKIDKEMDRTTAYRDVNVTDDATNIPGIETAASGFSTGDSYGLRSRARGARRSIKGGRSQLVEFVDKSRGKRKIVYCLDVSASMGAANRLNLARNYLKDSLLELDSKKDNFNVITFSKSTRTFYSSNLLPATKENVQSALDFLNEYTPQNIKANTKTNLLAVLIRALEMKPNIIALVTDGLPTAGVTNPEKIIQTVREKNLDNSVSIFAIGMEMDVEQPQAWLLKAIAEGNRGEYQFL